MERDPLGTASRVTDVLDRIGARYSIGGSIESSIKIDLFVAGGTALDDALLRRRRSVIAGEAGREFFVHSPEDILLQKPRVLNQ